MKRDPHVYRADGRMACEHRRSGYVRQSDIIEHGSYEAALAVLNAGNVVALRRKVAK